MAYIRAHETTQKRKGKPVRRYEVCWREPATDANGLPNGKTKARQESYPTREAAEVRRDELNAARHTGTTAALADARKAGAATFGYYAAAWLAEQRRRHAEGTLKVGTLDNYERVLGHDILPRFSGKAIGAITLVDCEAFRADLATRLSRRTVQNVWWPFAAVFRYAQRAGALQASPADAIDRTTSTRAPNPNCHHPLTGPQAAALAAAVGRSPGGHPAYELLVLFACYTGLRRGEMQGLEVRDITLSTAPDGTTKGSVRVQRTKTRRHAEWVTGTPKSKTSRRTVPLPPWLAAKLADYLQTTHPNAHNPQAPLWPRRQVGGARYKGQRAAVRLDWSEPCDLNGLQSKVIRPALEAVGLPASRPAVPATPTAPALPATKGVRLHDFRHTLAAMQLSAGTHFMQVSKWLGHASYVITLTVYADWIPEEDTGNTLPEPVAAPVKPNVVNLFG